MPLLPSHKCGGGLATKSNKTVRRMFQVIDARDWDELPSFFHTDVIYERPGFPQLRGLTDLINFYREVRPIESGCHELESVVTDDNHVVACGTFRGKLRDGTQAQEMFADLYTLKDDRIWRRRTYFYRPAV